MTEKRTICLFILTVSVWQGVSASFEADSQVSVAGQNQTRAAAKVGTSNESSTPKSLRPQYHLANNRSGEAALRQQVRGGIIEDIADKYRKRYAEWKDEFLSTETGRRQWETYVNDSEFTLTITISNHNPNGGDTSYEWDNSGRLEGATIVLGNRIDLGYPNPIYYPVMNSLATEQFELENGADILAATKIAHEFGHVNHLMVADGALYQLQNRLIPAYNKILLSNGRNAKDPRLVDLAHRMGGTPVEVWEDREYWGEANAMLFLRDRIAKGTSRCAVFQRIRRSVDLYAQNYAERFIQIAQSTSSTHPCGWQ
jgi:YD repeat-containing protein